MWKCGQKLQTKHNKAKELETLICYIFLTLKTYKSRGTKQGKHQELQVLSNLNYNHYILVDAIWEEECRHNA
jgi:hypothetical protein